MGLMEQKVDFLGGQVKALMNFAAVLITTHPSPKLLKQDFEAAELVGQAMVEGQTVSDEFLQGMRDVNDQIVIALKTATQ